MVKRVSMLDRYSRQLLAPLGIVFPFPMFCSKLDSYMKNETQLSAYFSSSKGAVVFFALLTINQLLALFQEMFFQISSFGQNGHQLPLTSLQT